MKLQMTLPTHFVCRNVSDLGDLSGKQEVALEFYQLQLTHSELQQVIIHQERISREEWQLLST